MDFVSILIMSAVVLFLAGFYAIGAHLNKNTPLPEGCDLPSVKCEHCSSTSCSYAEPNRIDKIKTQIKESLRENNSGEGVINE